MKRILALLVLVVVAMGISASCGSDSLNGTWED